MKHLGRRGGLQAVGLALALAGATLVGCGDDNSPAPTATGGAAATRTATKVPTQQGAATATRTAGASATFTPTPDAAQPTQTQGSNPAKAKVETFVANAFGDLLNLSSFLSFGGSSLTGGSAAVPGLPGGITIPPVPCPSGGTLQIGCGSGFEINFAQCKVAGGGAQSLIDGTFTIGGGGSCPSIPGPGQPFNIGVDADISTSGGGQARNISINLSESILLSSEGTRLEVNGDANVDCIGPVQIQTMEPIFVPTDAACPTQGAMRVGIAGTNSIIHSTAAGGIDLDLDADGSMDVSYANCDDPAPSSCN